MKINNNMLKYGRKLKKYLQNNNIKQKHFAAEMQVSVITVNNSWINQNKKPTKSNADKICWYTNGIISLKSMGY